MGTMTISNTPTLYFIFLCIVYTTVSVSIKITNAVNNYIKNKLSNNNNIMGMPKKAFLKYVNNDTERGN